MMNFFQDGAASQPLGLAAFAAAVNPDPRRAIASPMTESGELSPSSRTPEELARRCQDGCPDSFAELVRLHQDRVFHYLWRLTGNAHDAEDIAQDTFVKAHRALHRFDGSGSFTAWLFVIAKRTALNHFRSTRREIVSETAEEIDHTTPALLLEQADEQASIWKVARQLKPDQYEALWLRYGENFSIAETARVMRTNQIRVRVLIHRARGQLAQWLDRGGANRKGAATSQP